MRIAGYDHIKIGDHFKVPRQVRFVLNDSDEFLHRVLAGLAPKIEEDIYIRLPEGDKLLDNSQKDSVE